MSAYITGAAQHLSELWASNNTRAAVASVCNAAPQPLSSRVASAATAIIAGAESVHFISSAMNRSRSRTSRLINFAAGVGLGAVAYQFALLTACRLGSVPPQR
jgi:hypothetical protein